MILRFIKNHSWVLTAFLAVVLIPQSITVQSKLEGRLVVTGIAIDKENDKYIITAQAASPSSGYISGDDAAGIDFITVSASSVREGITEIATTTSKVPGMGHLNFILIGRSIFDEDISSVIDFVVRDSHSDTSVLLLVAENASEEIKKTKDLELGSAIQLRKLFLSKYKMCKATMTTANQFISNKFNPSRSGIINYLEITTEQTENKQNSSNTSSQNNDIGLMNSSQTNQVSNAKAIKQGRIKYVSPIALFSDGYYMGELSTEEEILGYNMLCCKSKNFISGFNDVMFDDGTKAKITLQSKNKKSSLSVNIKNGKPQIKIKASLFDNQILEIISQDNNINNYKTQNGYLNENVKNSIKKQLKSAAIAAYNKSVSLNVDILNACNYLYRHHNKQYNQYFKNHSLADFLHEAEFSFEVKIGNSTK